MNPATDMSTGSYPLGSLAAPTQLAVSDIGPEAGDIYVTDPLNGIVTVINPG